MAEPRRHLRAVTSSTPKTKPKTLSVSQAAASGDHRALLIAIRERIAATVSSPDCPPRDLAALTKRLSDIAKEIEAIDLRRKEEGADADNLDGDEDFDPETL